MDKELKNYIDQQRSTGVSDLQIRQALTTQGWSQSDLDQAFGVVPTAPIPPVVPSVPIPPSVPFFNSTPPPPPSQVDFSGNKGMAILAYLGPLILVPFLTEAKNDPFVKFHLKQGLVLIIVSIGWNILRFIISEIPGFSWALFRFSLVGFILSLVSLGFLVIGIIGIINVVNGRMKELPIIGQFAKHFNF